MALIKKRLGIEAVVTPGETGQFDVLADGEKLASRGGNWFTRSFGAGYPDLDSVVERLEKRGT
ncbi:MAG: family hydrolase [Candidatus Angelobacter sp.]|nr:family hydrolase [Candidatus Angelobacter sp.]